MTLKSIGWTVRLLMVAMIGSVLNAQQPAAVRFQSEPSYDESILQIRSQLQGIARPHRKAELRPDVSGMVKRVHVKEGQAVVAGTPLLTLAGQPAIAALNLAKAEANQTAALRTAELNVQQMAAQLRNMKEAVRRQAGSEYELQAKQYQYHQAVASRDLILEQKRISEAKLKVAQAGVDALTILAPFDGRVLQIHASLGNFTTPAETAITFAALDKLKVEMHLPVAMFGTLKVGTKQTLVASEPVDAEIKGVVSFASPEVESTSGTFRCVMEVDNTDLKLPSGFHVLLKSQAKKAAGHETRKVTHQAVGR